MLLPLILLLLPVITPAQVQHPIVGKWKVILVNNGVIVDFKNNTETVSGEFAESLKGRADSAAGVAVFARMARKYNNYFFVFRKDGIYQEIMNGSIRSDIATYHLFEDEHIVYMRNASNLQDAEQSMIYNIRKDGVLELTIYFMEKKMMLELERVEEEAGK
jgi:hypothetical protein